MSVVHFGAFESAHKVTRAGQALADKGDECGICLEKLYDHDHETYEFYKCDNCNKYFHGDCARKWFAEHGQEVGAPYVVNSTGHKCPLCRAEWPMRYFERRKRSRGTVDNEEQEDNADNDEALINASSTGNDGEVVRLLAAGANVNADAGRALRNASSRGHDAVVARLLAAGAT